MRRNVWITFVLIVLVVLAGGYVVYPSAPDLAIGSYRKELKVHLGLDLQGGTRLVYDADTARVQANAREDALQGVRDVIERRVNAFGVSEPVVQTSRVGDQWRVSVELAGVKDVQEAIRQIGETPLLDFREVAPAAPLRSEAEAQTRADEVATKLGQPTADFTALAKAYSDDPGSKDSGGDLGFARRGQFVPEFEKILFDTLSDGQVSSVPLKTQFGYHLITRIESRQIQEGEQSVLEVHGRHILVAINDLSSSNGYAATGLSGKQLRSASVQFNPTTGEPEVSLRFDDEGTKLFAEITKRNVGKQVAIFLDNAPISVPVVQQEITGGTAVITGDFTIDEAKTLARRLNAGALPVPITLVSQQTVGPTLGQDSVTRSLFAGLVGIAVVMLFMIGFYRLPGLLASIALVAYAVIVLAIFKLWPVTLTLAGVAGFILSIGMAVDANILIFERFREELRAGRPLQSALDEGFRRAWLSIRDSNVSSLITAFILAWFGTSIIKGFAVTLAVGIIVSMFSAITISRTFLRVTSTPWLDRHRGLIGPRLNASPPAA
jgi:preprotein translocase subunit SecD